MHPTVIQPTISLRWARQRPSHMTRHWHVCNNPCLFPVCHPDHGSTVDAPMFGSHAGPAYVNANNTSWPSYGSTSSMPRGGVITAGSNIQEHSSASSCTSVFDSNPYLKGEILPNISPSGSKQVDDTLLRLRCLIPDCHRCFTSEYAMRLHSNSHISKQQAAFKCTLGCPEKFSRRHDRLRHEVRQHGRVCDWVCWECRRYFSSERTLRNHRCPFT